MLLDAVLRSPAALANLLVPFSIVGEQSADAALIAAPASLLVFIGAFFGGAEHPLGLTLGAGVALFLLLHFGLVPPRAGQSTMMRRRRSWLNFSRRLQRHHRLRAWLLARHREALDAAQSMELVSRQRHREALGAARKMELASYQWKALDGVGFERYIGEVLAELGYRVVQFTPASGDFGVDLVIEVPGNRIAVQVKHTRSPVGVGAVQEVVAGAAMYGCSGLMVVSSGGFTEAARRLAGTHRCQLLTMTELTQALRRRSSAPGHS